MRFSKRKARLSPYKRDVYLAFLVNGARRTQTDGFPIIEPWMVASDPPKTVCQWDQRSSASDPVDTTLCFYCEDSTFQSVLNYPRRYLPTLNLFRNVIGMDSSPYDNMPLVVQKSQIFLNLALTYYWGRNGIKVIPNLRIGDPRTLSSLEAYPKHTLLAVGTSGFMWALNNRNAFRYELQMAIQELQPTGLVVYGTAPDWLFCFEVIGNIPIFRFDSFLMGRRREK